VEVQGAQMDEDILGLEVVGLCGYKQVCQDGLTEVGLCDCSLVLSGHCLNTGNASIDELESEQQHAELWSQGQLLLEQMTSGD
jgi:hypothetical protein